MMKNNKASATVGPALIENDEAFNMINSYTSTCNGDDAKSEHIPLETLISYIASMENAASSAGTSISGLQIFLFEVWQPYCASVVGCYSDSFSCRDLW